MRGPCGPSATWLLHCESLEENCVALHVLCCVRGWWGCCYCAAVAAAARGGGGGVGAVEIDEVNMWSV